MRTGLIISASAHGALLVVALEDGFFSVEPPNPDQEITLDAVQILSEEEFAAISSVAPEFVPFAQRRDAVCNAASSFSNKVKHRCLVDPSRAPGGSNGNVKYHVER